MSASSRKRTLAIVFRLYHNDPMRRTFVDLILQNGQWNRTPFVIEHGDRSLTEIGKVIVLNGTSSSGKSTLARRLQQKLEETYLHCQLDAFWNMTPHGILASSVNFPNMKLAMAKSVRALVDTGHNVVVDIVYSGLKSHLEFSSELDGLAMLVVKVDCKLDELERRERARGDRRLGLARSQMDNVHEAIPYDLEIDTSALSPDECVEKIVANLNHPA